MGAEVKTTVLALHVHNWLIESPGPGKHILMGTCRGCGVTRGFTGGIDEEMGQSHNRAASQHSAAWKSQAALRILTGESVKNVAADMGHHVETVRKVKQRIGARIKGAEAT